jgi:molybdate transport system regulatory protein
MTRLSIRIDFGEERIGPGKARLLELIGENGSIASAARVMGMSYRRAWLLIDALNAMFGPVVEAAAGGVRGGQSVLTVKGKAVLRHFRAAEVAASRAAAGELRALRRAASKRSPL